MYQYIFQGFVSNSEASVPSVEPISNELKSSSPKKLKLSSTQITCVNATLTLPFNEEKAFKNGPHLKSGNLSLQDILKKAYRGKNSVGDSSTTNKTKKCFKQKTPSNDNIGNFFFKKLSQKVGTNEIDDSDISTPVITLYRNSNDSSTSDANNTETVEQVVEKESVLDELRLRRKTIKTIKFDMATIKNYIESKSK